ncbi:209_t:CDS:1, partial [Scutellospora calospora]
MANNIFFKYLTKENMISIINYFSENLLMNLIENKCHFTPKITFTYGKQEPFFPVNVKKYNTSKEKLSERWSDINNIVFPIKIDSNDDLKMYFIDSIIKNIFPKILFIHSQYSPEELGKKVNDINFFDNHYSKNELSLFFEKVPYFGIHQDVSLIHLHKMNITEYDQKEVFVINFDNIDLKH